jgi:hypothetical protein
VLADAGLTGTERQLVDAAAAGELVDLQAGDLQLDHPGQAANWGEERSVRADLLAELLTGRCQPGAGPVRSVKLRPFSPSSTRWMSCYQSSTSVSSKHGSHKGPPWHAHGSSPAQAGY